MNTSSQGVQTIFSGQAHSRSSAQADTPYDVIERSMSLRSERSGGDAEIPPERRLMIALVRDSIRSIIKYRNARDSRGQRLFAEEAEWMLSNDMGWLYAFARVCESLDLDPESVRRCLGLVSGAVSRRSLRSVARPGPKPTILRRIPC